MFSQDNNRISIFYLQGVFLLRFKTLHCNILDKNLLIVLNFFVLIIKI